MNDLFEIVHHTLLTRWFEELMPIIILEADKLLESSLENINFDRESARHYFNNLVVGSGALEKYLYTVEIFDANSSIEVLKILTAAVHNFPLLYVHLVDSSTQQEEHFDEPTHESKLLLSIPLVEFLKSPPSTYQVYPTKKKILDLLNDYQKCLLVGGDCRMLTEKEKIKTSKRAMRDIKDSQTLSLQREYMKVHMRNTKSSDDSPDLPVAFDYRWWDSNFYIYPEEDDSGNDSATG
jgi:hypothetical protein